MTMKKIYITTICVVCLIPMSKNLMAQKDFVYHKNFVGVTLTELVFTDIRINVEHRIQPEHGVKIDLGYKPAYKSYTDATNIDLGLKPTQWCYRNTAQWIYVGVGYRFYFGHKKLVYVSPELFYKSGSADEIAFTYGLVNSSTITNDYSIRSMRANITGMNFLIGKRMRIEYNDQVQLGFDMYLGVSMRYRNVHETIFGSTVASYYHDSSPNIGIPFDIIPTEVYTNSWDLSAQFGIVFYGSW
jgi:hypothetical protein